MAGMGQLPTGLVGVVPMPPGMMAQPQQPPQRPGQPPLHMQAVQHPHAHAHQQQPHPTAAVAQQREQHHHQQQQQTSSASMVLQKLGSMNEHTWLQLGAHLAPRPLPARNVAHPWMLLLSRRAERDDARSRSRAAVV